MTTSSRLREFGSATVVACLVTSLTISPRSTNAADSDRLTVHEWGTFTALQDDQGNELSGINTDDEPLPPFVHNLNPFLLSKPVLSSLHWQYRQKGAPRMHPYITMRLETPVIYFYPPKAWPAGKTVDVSVNFLGGWLTEYYPKARPQTPGLDNRQFQFGEITPQTISTLTWSNLKVGTDGVGPATDERVWLAPRHVHAANVTSEDGESERYLFYRGVGRLHAPLRAKMNRKAGELTLSPNFGEVLSSRQTEQIPSLWLLEVREDHQCAWRSLHDLAVSGDASAAIATVNYRFASSEFRSDNLPRLQSTMHKALLTGGLSATEADALLSTWKISYFLSPGLRMFYIVPRVWTDHYLPLSISTEARTERVMVGRLELVSDERQALLNQLARTAISDGKWVERIPESPARERFLAGRTDFGDLGVPIPADYQLYLSLGRFRNALVVHEEHVRPTPNLTKFIDSYALHPFRIPVETQARKPGVSHAVGGDDPR